MHSKDAAENGETLQRIHAVAVWAESPFFTEKERAAFAFTESVTRLAETHVPTADYDAVAAHWSPDEVGALAGPDRRDQRVEHARRHHPSLGAG